MTTTPRRLADIVLRSIRDGLGDDPFDVTVCGDEVPARKPDPAPYLQAMAALGVEPGECVVIEDSQAGITAGLAAGVAVLGVPDGAGGRAGAGAHPARRLVGVGVAELADVLADRAWWTPDRRAVRGRQVPGAAPAGPRDTTARGPLEARSRRSAGRRRPAAGRRRGRPPAVRCARSRPQARAARPVADARASVGGHPARVTRSATAMGTSPCRLLGPMPASVPASEGRCRRACSSATCDEVVLVRRRRRPRAAPARAAAGPRPGAGRGSGRRTCRPRRAGRPAPAGSCGPSARQAAAVLDAVDAGGEAALHRRQAVGVRGDRQAVPVRLVHDGPQLVEA